MARLRRDDGCPWDREQTHESLLQDFASEVEEYAEAVRSADWSDAAEELGDVLVNVLMQAQIGTEAGHFSIEDVLTSINAKLVRRHPHVFAGVEAHSPEDVLAVWNSVKSRRRLRGPPEPKPDPTCILMPARCPISHDISRFRRRIGQCGIIVRMGREWDVSEELMASLAHRSYSTCGELRAEDAGSVRHTQRLGEPETGSRRPDLSGHS